MLAHSNPANRGWKPHLTETATPIPTDAQNK